MKNGKPDFAHLTRRRRRSKILLKLLSKEVFMVKKDRDPFIEPHMLDAKGKKINIPVRQLFDVMAGANEYHEMAKFLFARKHDLSPKVVHDVLQRGRQTEENGGRGSRIELGLWKVYCNEIENNGGNVREYVRSQVENPRALKTEMMRYARDDWDTPVEYQLDKFLDLIEPGSVKL